MMFLVGSFIILSIHLFKFAELSPNVIWFVWGACEWSTRFTDYDEWGWWIPTHHAHRNTHMLCVERERVWEVCVRLHWWWGVGWWTDEPQRQKSKHKRETTSMVGDDGCYLKVLAKPKIIINVCVLYTLATGDSQFFFLPSLNTNNETSCHLCHATAPRSNQHTNTYIMYILYYSFIQLDRKSYQESVIALPIFFFSVYIGFPLLVRRCVPLFFFLSFVRFCVFPCFFCRHK